MKKSTFNKLSNLAMNYDLILNYTKAEIASMDINLTKDLLQNPKKFKSAFKHTLLSVQQVLYSKKVNPNV